MLCCALLRRAPFRSWYSRLWLGCSATHAQMCGVCEGQGLCALHSGRATLTHCLPVIAGAAARPPVPPPPPTHPHAHAHSGRIAPFPPPRWYSPFLLAVYDPQAEELQSLCRCMSGFSDAFYREATARQEAAARGTSNWLMQYARPFKYSLAGVPRVG